MNTLTFKIMEYDDHTYRVETKHIAYHMADGLLQDDVKPDELYDVMMNITDICNNKYGIGAIFEIA